MPRISDAKIRFIDTAARLFRRSGYNGVGVAEIIAASNAPRGSFYHHFPEGKEELAEQAVRRAASLVSKAIDQAFDGAASFEDGARGLAEMVAGWFEASNWSEGCPITSIVLDTTPGSERLTRATVEVLDGWIDRLTAHAARLGGVADPRAASLRLLVALEGAWIVARVMRSREPFRQVAAMAALR